MGEGGAAGVHCTACSDDVSSTGFKAVAERPKPRFHDDTPRRRRCGSIRREAIKAEGLRAVNQPVSLSIMRVLQRNNSNKKRTSGAEGQPELPRHWSPRAESPDRGVSV